MTVIGKYASSCLFFSSRNVVGCDMSPRCARASTSVSVRLRRRRRCFVRKKGEKESKVKLGFWEEAGSVFDRLGKHPHCPIHIRTTVVDARAKQASMGRSREWAGQLRWPSPRKGHARGIGWAENGPVRELKQPSSILYFIFLTCWAAKYWAKITLRAKLN